MKFHIVALVAGIALAGAPIIGAPKGRNAQRSTRIARNAGSKRQNQTRRRVTRNANQAIQGRRSPNGQNRAAVIGAARRINRAAQNRQANTRRAMALRASTRASARRTSPRRTPARRGMAQRTPARRGAVPAPAQPGNWQAPAGPAPVAPGHFTPAPAPRSVPAQPAPQVNPGRANPGTNPGNTAPGNNPRNRPADDDMAEILEAIRQSEQREAGTRRNDTQGTRRPEEAGRADARRADETRRAEEARRAEARRAEENGQRARPNDQADEAARRAAEARRAQEEADARFAQSLRDEEEAAARAEAARAQEDANQTEAQRREAEARRAEARRKAQNDTNTSAPKKDTTQEQPNKKKDTKQPKKDEAQRPCTICMENATPATLACGHSSFCADCVNGIIETAARDNNTETLRCPECRKKLAMSDVRKFAKNKAHADKIEKALKRETAREFANIPGMKRCPGNDCHNVFENFNDHAYERTCPDCNTRHCASCGSQPGHIGQTCREAAAAAAAQRAQSKDRAHDAANDAWKRSHNTKPCPNCGLPTEREKLANGQWAACNHMTCTACHHHWCWDCLQPSRTGHYVENGRCRTNWNNAQNPQNQFGFNQFNNGFNQFNNNW